MHERILAALDRVPVAVWIIAGAVILVPLIIVNSRY